MSTRKETSIIGREREARESAKKENMKTTELLKAEMAQKPEGAYAPYYFKYLGYRQDYTAPKTEARANAVYALFTKPRAYIYKNDWIAGSIRPLWVQADAEVLVYAGRVVNSYGERDFTQNVDHFSPDYRRLVREGVPGLLRSIQKSMRKHAAQPEKVAYLRAMRRTVLGWKGMIRRYAKQAAACGHAAGYDEEKLGFIQKNCEFLTEHSPQTFAQALQLVWLCHQSFLYEGRAAMALGRMDQYLYPFYRKDKDEGILTDAFARELLENTFLKIYEHRAYRDVDETINICIGGTSPNGGCDVNELSYLILQAVRECNVPGPNLSARIAANTPDRFLDECLQVIGTGLGYPALMNDEVNLRALREYGYAAEDVYDYSMVGCIENFLSGRQPPWSDGRFDAPRFLEYMFNRGRGIRNKSVGIDTGDLSKISSMDEFIQKFERQLQFGVDEYVMFFNNQNTRLNAEEYEQPYLSCFCEDCIGRAQDICRGGSKYPSVHGAALMGIGTVSDSLAAIEQVVFTDRAATLSDLARALKKNFAGYEWLRQKLLAAPKYGNDDWFVDKYAVWFVDTLARLFSRYRTKDGGPIYIAMAANISNIYAGQTIAATPDGRRSGEALSDAASPTYGCDVLGATATLNSVARPDYTKVACGTVLNQKFSPGVFAEEEKRKKLLALIKVYFRKGGQEIQINATSREVLKDAMDHPEKYPTLVVRVSGFSALYVTLAREIQEDILRRTQQE